jgi:hypothetical protein
MSIGQSLPYRSPVSKLLRFFRRSRDNWKAKCKAAKRENKSLKTRLSKMKESRDRWKARAQGSAMDTKAESPPRQEGKKGVGHRPEGNRGRVA